MPTTPNMNLDLPTVGVTIDPTWASKINTAFDSIDEHDHSTGAGVAVPTAGLNINADLSFQSNDATNLRSLALNNNVSTLPDGDIRALYASSGNLYYNNNDGNAIRITNGTSLDTGSLALNVWALTELAGNLTILAGDSFVFINTSTASARVITLPAADAVTAGRYYIVKDKTGSGSTNVITITPAGADTIDGVASSITVNSAYGSVTLVSDGVSGWLTNAAIGGFVRIGGDLLGTGTSVTAPRVGTLTGIAALVTMANNTALNTRNAANDTNVNLAKMSAANIVSLGDAAFETKVNGTIARVIAATGTCYIESTVGDASVQAGNDILLGAVGDINVQAVANLILNSTNDTDQNVTRDWSLDCGRDGYAAFARDLDIEVGDDANLYAADNITINCGNNGGGIATANILMDTTPTVGTINITTSGTNSGITIAASGTGADVAITAADRLTLTGKLFLPTKAVTSASYTADTTTNDVVMFCDSTSNAINITLPAAVIGRYLVIQDVGGNAGTNNITLTRADAGEQIQGLTANYVMDANYQGVTLCAYSGGSWFIVGTS